MYVLGNIFLIHVSLGSIYALEYDAPIAFIIWFVWMINANLGSVYFKYHDLKNDTEPNQGVKILRNKTSFKALYHQLAICHMSTWYPHSMEPEPGEIFICSERNGSIQNMERYFNIKVIWTDLSIITEIRYTNTYSKMTIP